MPSPVSSTNVVRWSWLSPPCPPPGLCPWSVVTMIPHVSDDRVAVEDVPGVDRRAEDVVRDRFPVDGRVGVEARLGAFAASIRVDPRTAVR